MMPKSKTKRGCSCCIFIFKTLELLLSSNPSFMSDISNEPFRVVRLILRLACCLLFFFYRLILRTVVISLEKKVMT